MPAQLLVIAPARSWPGLSGEARSNFAYTWATLDVVSSGVPWDEELTSEPPQLTQDRKPAQVGTPLPEKVAA